TSQKKPLDIWGSKNISVLNFNKADDKFSPIVLYVIDKAIAVGIEYAIYDAVNMNDIAVNSKLVTVMSAEAFTVKAKRNDFPIGVRALLAGFDSSTSANSDSCMEAFNSPIGKNFPGFNINVAGPIISLLFSDQNVVHIDASIQSTDEFSLPVYDLSFDGFITSDGYNGCFKPHTGGIQSFRSPLYEKSKSYLLGSPTATKPDYRVSITVLPNLDANHSVIVNDLSSNDQPKTIIGVIEVDYTIEKTSNIEVVFDDLDGDQGFLMRYTTAPFVETTTETLMSGSTNEDLPTTSSVPSSTSTVPPTTTSGGEGTTCRLLFAIGAIFAARVA
ncbi:hypothetical protein PMAYCL1PPCAC_22423, partial [Pristionchus mayeri]